MLHLELEMKNLNVKAQRLLHQDTRLSRIGMLYDLDFLILHGLSSILIGSPNKMSISLISSKERLIRWQQSTWRKERPVHLITWQKLNLLVLWNTMVLVLMPLFLPISTISVKEIMLQFQDLEESWYLPILVLFLFMGKFMTIVSKLKVSLITHTFK